MINSWWFQLYTKKNLILIALLCPLLVLLDLILPEALEGTSFFILAVLLFWVVFKISRVTGQMKENYELFLNSFTVKEIVRTWYIHGFISLIGLGITLHFTSLVLSFTRGPFFVELQALTGYFSWPIIYLFLFYATFIYLLMSLSMAKEMERGRKTHSFVAAIPAFFGLFLTTMISSTIGISLALVGFGFHVLMTLLVMVIIFTSLFMRVEFLSRRTEYLIGFKGTFKGTLYSFLFCIPLFVLATYLSSLSFYSSGLKTDQKVLRYGLGSPFITLNRETFVEIASHLQDESVSLDFDLNRENPDFFLENKLFMPLYDHLRSGKVTSEFLVRLYDDFEAQEEKWKKFKLFPTVRYVAYEAWPKDEELPERFIKQKQSLRDIAAKRKD